MAFPVPPKSRFEEALKKRSDALGEQKIAAKNGGNMGKHMGKRWKNMSVAGGFPQICLFWTFAGLLPFFCGRRCVFHFDDICF